MPWGDGISLFISLLHYLRTLCFTWEPQVTSIPSPVKRAGSSDACVSWQYEVWSLKTHKKNVKVLVLYYVGDQGADEAQWESDSAMSGVICTNCHRVLVGKGKEVYQRSNLEWKGPPKWLISCSEWQELTDGCSQAHTKSQCFGDENESFTSWTLHSSHSCEITISVLG